MGEPVTLQARDRKWFRRNHHDVSRVGLPPGSSYILISSPGAQTNCCAFVAFPCEAQCLCYCPALIVFTWPPVRNQKRPETRGESHNDTQGHVPANRNCCWSVFVS